MVTPVQRRLFKTNSFFQFVLVNVVVAVLMKHLEESNKKMADTASEAGQTTPGATDTDGNYRTDDTEEQDNEEEEDEDEVLLLLFVKIGKILNNMTT